jgi:hypothetical protein
MSAPLIAAAIMQERAQQQQQREDRAGDYQYSARSSGARSDKFRTYVIWGIAGAVTLAVAGYFGYKYYRYLVSNAAQKGAFDNQEPAYFAKKIKAGIDNNNWPGTDTVAIRQAFVEMPTKEMYRQTASNYQKQYGSNLYKDLEKHLKTTELQEIAAIYRIKPERSAKEAPLYDPTSWAERLNAAVNYEEFGLFWGTDEDAIKQVFVELPTQAAWEQVQQAYYEKYGLDLETELDDDLSESDYNFRAAVAKKPLQ